MAMLTLEENQILDELTRIAGPDRVVNGKELLENGFADFCVKIFGANVSYPQSLQSRKLQILRDKGLIRMERRDGGTYTIL